MTPHMGSPPNLPILYAKDRLEKPTDRYPWLGPAPELDTDGPSSFGATLHPVNLEMTY